MQFFGDLPVVEAKANLQVQPIAEDIENAVPGDPQNCAFAKACKRMYGSKGVLFFSTVAYIDLLDGKGRRVAMRHTISELWHAAAKPVDDKRVRAITQQRRLALLPCFWRLTARLHAERDAR